MSPLKRNPVFWLMWMILGAAVFAGLSMVAIAMQGADRALPDIYHWEGERLDSDFERARNAARLGVNASLEFTGGVCTVRLAGGHEEANALQLRLTNGSQVNLDRAVTLSRVAAGLYRAPCQSLQGGRWRVALSDDANTWALRADANGEFTRIDLAARSPEGPGG
jgi:hypothetical protein